MGGGNWDDNAYKTSAKTRKTSGIDDFAYSRTATAVHETLDPKRINGKPCGKLESRDSVEHPNSNAVFVDFDVTGSNRDRAKVAQKALDKLMTLLAKHLTDPQVAVAANDDFEVQPAKCIQISDFESDNRVDEHLRNIILVGDGGGNNHESYDLMLYALARKTVLDCFEKRGRKGYAFLYADEPIETYVDPKEVLAVFGDVIQKRIPIADIIAEVRKTYYLFVLSPVGGYERAHNQYIDLLGNEYVITLQDPNTICEAICSIIGVNEGSVTLAEAEKDLVDVKVDAKTAAGISQALIPLSKIKAITKVGGGLPAVGDPKKPGAKRL